MTGRQLVLVDEDGRPFGGSRPFTRAPSSPFSLAALVSRPSTGLPVEHLVAPTEPVLVGPLKSVADTQVHRHTRSGIRRAPCGALYTIPAAGPAGPSREHSA